MSEAAAKWLAVVVLVAAVAVFAIFVIGGEGNDTDADSVAKVWSGEVDDPPEAALDHPHMTDKRDWPNRRHRSDSRHWFDKPDRAGRPGRSGGPGWGLDHQRPMMPDGEGWMMPPGFDDDGEGWMGRGGGEMGPGRMGFWFGGGMLDPFGPPMMPGHGGPMMPGRGMGMGMGGMGMGGMGMGPWRGDLLDEASKILDDLFEDLFQEASEDLADLFEEPVADLEDLLEDAAE